MTISNAAPLPFSPVSGTGAPQRCPANTSTIIHRNHGGDGVYDYPSVYLYNDSSSSANFQIVHSGAGGTLEKLNAGSLTSSQGLSLLLPKENGFRGGAIMVSGTQPLIVSGGISRFTGVS